MRNPTSGGRGARENDQLGGKIVRENSRPILVVERLRRRLGVTVEVATVIAQLAGLGPQAVRQ